MFYLFFLLYLGNMYISDTQNHCIRKVTISTGIITTIAGTGSASYSGDNGQATSATLYFPHNVAFDSAGNIYYKYQVVFIFTYSFF